MRKIFAGAAAVSLAATVLFGGAFAWRTSDSARGAALVGENGFEITYQPVCDAVSDEPYLADPEETAADLQPIPCHTLIGPNGSTTEVGRGAGKNDGDFKLRVVGGEVDIRRLHRAENDCSVDDFSGAVRLLSPGEVIPPGGEGGKFVAFVSVDDGAPAGCQGELVYYRVTIFAENPGPADPASTRDVEAAAR
jgi:hypothetical protein